MINYQHLLAFAITLSAPLATSDYARADAETQAEAKKTPAKEKASSKPSESKGTTKEPEKAKQSTGNPPPSGDSGGFKPKRPWDCH